MTEIKRIIPRLEIKNDNLVKGINLEGLRVLGKPEDFAEYYYKNGADELLYQDVVASLYGTNSIEKIIKKTAKKIFIPLTVSGGIRNIRNISKLLKSGADKIAMNSAATRKPNIIKEAAKQFGTSTIVISIETQKINNEFYVFTENGRNNSKIKLFYWIDKIQKLGAGEIILTFINKEGTGSGFDLEYINKLIKYIDIPLIISGGAGDKYQIKDLLSYKKVSGVGISSIFHYDYVSKKSKKNINFNIGNTDFLKSTNTPSFISALDIKSLKLFLKKNNIYVNL